MIQTNFAKEIWKLKYRDSDESEQEFYNRIPNGLFNNSSKEDIKSYEKIAGDNFIEDCKCIISNHQGMLAGRGMYSVGTNKTNQTLSNCFVLPIEKDSMISIMDTAKNSALTMKAGGGVGYSFSILRPKNNIIKSSGSKSSGVVSFMNIYDTTCGTIQAGGNRRGAQMGALGIWHPDTIDFISCKRSGGFKNFNISLLISDEFMDAVKNDLDWNFIFPVTSYESYDVEWDGNIKGWIEKGYPVDIFDTMKARDLYDTIMLSNYKYAEPGILFEDTINKYNNLWWKEYILVSNPCHLDTNILLTKTGLRQLKDINIGEEIWSKEGWTTIINKFCTGIKPTYRYETTAGYFDGTDNHKIVENGKKIEIGKAKKIDILSGNNEDINIYDKKIIMDGLVIGDGSVHKASNNLVFLYIGDNDQDYFESEINDLIICERLGLHEKAYEIKTDIKYNELPKTFEREIPERYLCGDRSTISSFLRGLYSANGSVVAKGKRVTLKASSNKIIRQVQIMLSGLGITSYITTNKKRKNEFYNGEYEQRESYDLNITTDRDKFYKYIGFIQNYKNEKIDLGGSSTKKKKSYEIKNVVTLGEQKVWNITIDNDSHTLWCNGLNVSNCGEQPLFAYGSCNLGPINLSKFINKKFTSKAYFDFKKFNNAVRHMVIMLDRMLDISYFPLEKQKKEVDNKRPIGLGITALADMLVMMGIKYSSKEANLFVDDIMNQMKITAYQTSIYLAKEFGSFPDLDLDKFIQGKFIKKLPYKLIKDIRKYGIRNSRLLSVAPTGTISLIMDNCSSGIEPIYALEYFRKVKIDNDNDSETLTMNNAWRLYKDHHKINEDELNNIPDVFETAESLSIDAHLNMMTTVQKHVCTAISKTINVPIDYDYEKFKDIYWKAFNGGLKGCTTYRPNSIIGSVLTTSDRRSDTTEGEENFFTIWDSHGDGIVKESIKIPDEYNMHGYKIISEGKKWYIHVSFKDVEKKKPFAVFIQSNSREPEVNTLNAVDELMKLAKKSKIPKNLRDESILKCKGQTNINKIARTLGLLLRHNVDVCEIIKSLDCVDVPVSSFVYRIKKFLYKFSDKVIKVESCPECGGDLMLMEGCCKCSCGYSRC